MTAFAGGLIECFAGPREKGAPDDLEQVIVDFWDKQIDVLVCTTIVESGIDIANANTLIVDRADTFGGSKELGGGIYKQNVEPTRAEEFDR